MKKIFKLGVIATAMMCAACASHHRDTATTDLEANNVVKSGLYNIKDGDLNRKYRLYVPKGYNPEEPTALIVVFHGWGENENSYILEDSAMIRNADKRNYILVAPRGIGTEVDNSINSWSFKGSTTGLAGPDQTTPSGQTCDPEKQESYIYNSCKTLTDSPCSWTQCQTDDVHFVTNLVEDVKSKLNIDTDRIYAMGGSNGGMFTWEMGQNPQTAPIFSAIAPMIGIPMAGYLDGPGKDDGMPVLLITGDDDATVPNGDWEDPSYSTTTDGDYYYYTGATAIMRVWSEALGGSTDKPAEKYEVKVRNMDCRSYLPSVNGEMPKALDCRVVGMGHETRLSETFPLILDFFDQN